MARWIDDPAWNDAVGTALLVGISEAIFDQNEMRATWQGAGLPVADFPFAPSARIAWITMLKDAHARSRLGELLREVLSHKPALHTTIEAAFGPVALAGAPSWYTCADPYGARLISSGAVRVQVDRSGLSQALREVVRDGLPVCSIRGGAGSGKSHSWFLIQHVAKHVAREVNNDVDLLRIDIEKEWKAAFEAAEFVGMLARRLDMPASFVTEEFTNPQRVSHELAGLFVRNFRALPPRQRWLIVDGLDRPFVTDSARVFIGLLANAAANGELPGLRLFVTGYEAEFDQDVLDVLCEEQIGPIECHHVEHFFQEVASHSGQTLVEGEAQALAARTLQSADLADLRMLGRAVIAVANERFGPP
jgi:hypothetical protein